MKQHFDGLGAAFYPDQQPRGTWVQYIDLMVEGGMSFARVAEFAWDKLEPCEGKYDFGWLDDALEMLDQKGIKAIMCTPGAAPPVWLCEKYNVYPTLHDGSRLTFGSRRYVCPNSVDFNSLVGKMVAAMAAHYADDSRVCGWQVDNEIGHPFCYCPHCLQLFREYSQERFGTIENFNDSLETHFWGQTLQRFDQLLFPTQFRHSAIRMLYHEFYSKSVVECFGRQAELLRQYGVKVPISTNYMVTWYGFDHEAMSKHLDYCSGDYYFGGAMFGDGFHGVAFATAYLRGMKANVNPRFNEFRGGKGGSMPMPGEIRYHTLAAIALGADHVSYFRWDTCPSGNERDEAGIIRRLNQPGRCFDEVADLSREIEKMRHDLDGTCPPQAQTALLYSYEAQYDIAETIPCKELSGAFGNGYPIFLSRHFQALVNIGECPDIVYPGGDFSKYKLIVAPALIVLSDKLAKKIREFIGNGGVFLMLPLSGVYDSNNKLFPNGAPGPLADVFGVSVVDYGVCPDSANIVFHSENYPSFRVKSWIDEIVPAEGAVVIGTYEGLRQTETAAFTMRPHGKGKAFYLGTWADTKEGMEKFYRSFYEQIAMKAPNDDLPSGVYRLKRVAQGTEIEFLINSNMEKTAFGDDMLDSRDVKITINHHP